MYIKKIILIILLIIIITQLTKNISTFQNNENIKLIVDTSDYNTINLEQSKVKLDPNYNSSYNIDVGNDIIAEDNITINGKNLTIENLRYIKKLPIHYENEICLSDGNGIECIKKEHLDIVKGKLPMKLVTYPDNRRKCFKAHYAAISPEWTHGPWGYNIFSDGNCQNGDTTQEFFIERENQDSHNNDSHYHIHGINSNSHEFYEEPIIRTLPVVSNFDLSSVLTDENITRDQALNSGLTDAQFNQLDTDNDGFIKASDLSSLL